MRLTHYCRYNLTYEMPKQRWVIFHEIGALFLQLNQNETPYCFEFTSFLLQNITETIDVQHA